MKLTRCWPYCLENLSSRRHGRNQGRREHFARNHFTPASWRWIIFIVRLKPQITSLKRKCCCFDFFNHRLCWKFSFWQLLAHPMTKSPSKWLHFRQLFILSSHSSKVVGISWCPYKNYGSWPAESWPTMRSTCSLKSVTGTWTWTRQAGVYVSSMANKSPSNCWVTSRGPSNQGTPWKYT